MTKIGIISDTHGYLDKKILEILKDADLLIHAGDIGSLELLNELSSIKKTYAVYGNVDDFDLRQKLKEHQVLDLEGFKVFITHYIKKEHNTEQVDIIITGHSHIAKIEYDGKKLFINPGSSNPKKSIPENKPSVVIIELSNASVVSSNIIFF